MDFAFSDDQQQIRELARKILEEQSTHERLKEVEAGEDRVDHDTFAELARANLLGVAIPEEHGGMGFGLLELCLLLEEVGRSVAQVPVYPSLVLGALPLQVYGSDAQKERWLPQVASGEAILTAALAEAPGAAVEARRDGDGWRLTGRRALVPAGHVAHRILVPATTGNGPAFFLVDPRTDGVALERAEVTNREIRPHLELQDVRVPKGEILGDPGEGDRIAAWLRDRATLALCAMQVGVAERALRMTASYVTERKQFDRPIGSFQAVHTRAGDAYVDVQAMTLTFWRALHQVDHGEDATETLAIAKYWASEAGHRVTYAAQHLHGGIGVDIDYPVHRYYLWAHELGMHLGSGSAHLARLGERIAASG
ncbi:MAG: acyl-CoA dehydrogenase family protein [Myxococcota bacterium]|nr:acyl-CoA dehydrogenase family protein [Myxococcota bacterium]